MRLIDIAKLAGVSKATASRAFSHPEQLHEDTLKRVLDIASMFNYHPNALAKAVAHQRSGLVGFILFHKSRPFFGHTFYGPALDGFLERAKAKGYSIKLLGVSRKCSAPDAPAGIRMEVMTAPFLVPEGHPLHSVSDVFNGVLVHGNMVDDVMFYGRGAGKLPTGSAVVADMILAAKNIGHTVPIQWEAEVLETAASSDCTNAFFVRMHAADAAKVHAAFGDCIDQVWSDETDAEFVFVTKPVKEGVFFDCLQRSGEALSVIRML